jgi:hypothetical protein
MPHISRVSVTKPQAGMSRRKKGNPTHTAGVTIGLHPNARTVFSTLTDGYVDPHCSELRLS